jgi:hypothetical protein
MCGLEGNMLGGGWGEVNCEAITRGEKGGDRVKRRGSSRAELHRNGRM